MTQLLLFVASEDVVKIEYSDGSRDVEWVGADSLIACLPSVVFHTVNDSKKV